MPGFRMMPEATCKSVKSWGRARLYTLAVAAFVIVLVVATMMRPSVPELAKSVRIGDSKSQVKKILGEPLDILNPPPEGRTNYVGDLLFGLKETWAYGKSLELARSGNFPYVQLDLKFRFLRPYTDDVAIEYGHDGRVSKVTIPNNAR
jgi:hypothetical protein